MTRFTIEYILLFLVIGFIFYYLINDCDCKESFSISALPINITENLILNDCWPTPRTDCDAGALYLCKLNIDRNCSNANLSYCDFANTKLQGPIFTNSNLTRANFANATFTNAYLTGANFTNASASGATLTNASASGANFTNATLTGADLWRANFTNASLTGTNLTGVSLDFANLTGADLTGANLTRTDLSGAILHNVIRPHNDDYKQSIFCDETTEFDSELQNYNDLINECRIRGNTLF